jgi:hypothetical protein
MIYRYIVEVNGGLWGIFGGIWNFTPIHHNSTVTVTTIGFINSENGNSFSRSSG